MIKKYITGLTVFCLSFCSCITMIDGKEKYASIIITDTELILVNKTTDEWGSYVVFINQTDTSQENRLFYTQNGTVVNKNLLSMSEIKFPLNDFYNENGAKYDKKLMIIRSGVSFGRHNNENYELVIDYQ